VSVAFYILGIFVATFALSGVVPCYRAIRARRERIEAFEANYRRWSDLHGEMINAEEWIGAAVPDDISEASDRAMQEAAPLRGWLVARRDEMQGDAQAAGRGTVYTAPPPMIGGGYQPHYYFSDLFDAQTYAEHSSSFRVDELTTILHTTLQQERHARRALWSPWRWVQLSFERLLRFPAYVLRAAGFSESAANAPSTRAIGILWSFLVGVATIYPVLDRIVR
jgi:hypothetical protein